GPVREVLDVFQEPLDLGAGEVRIEDEPGAIANEAFPAFRSQLVTAAGRPPVLPDDRAMEWLAGSWVPCNDGLALVRDPDPLEVAGSHPGCFERLRRHRMRDPPDLAGVVLHPARPRKVLLELAIGAARDPG